MTEQPHFHFSLSCIGEGNGSPLQCSCLENPRDRGAWWAAVYGVTQSGTRLKRLSSSSSSSLPLLTILWNFAFSWVYLSISPLSASLLSSAICKTTTLPSSISVSLGGIWSLPPVQCCELPSIVLQALCYQISSLESIHHLHCLFIRDLI